MYHPIRSFLCALGLASSVFHASLSAASAENPLQTGLTEAIQLAVVGKYGDARSLLKKISIEYPDSPETYNNLAVLTAHKGDWQDAVSLLEKALATNRSLQTSYENLNQVYRYQAALAYRAALPQTDSKPLLPPTLTLLTPSPAFTDNTENTENTPEFNWVNAAVEPEQESEIQAVVQPDKTDNSVSPNDITDALHQWAAAWSSQDIDAYLANYIDGYVPDGGIDHES